MITHELIDQCIVPWEQETAGCLVCHVFCPSQHLQVSQTRSPIIHTDQRKVTSIWAVARAYEWFVSSRNRMHVGRASDQRCSLISLVLRKKVNWIDVLLCRGGPEGIHSFVIFLCSGAIKLHHILIYVQNRPCKSDNFWFSSVGSTTEQYV